MPAYRSDAEGEVRRAVVARLRQIRPASRIIHEINAEFYGNRIDVLCVGEAEIIAVEIKSERDKLDRLPAQIKAMQKVAHHSVAALHEKFLVEHETNQWASQYVRNGKHYLKAVPDEANGVTTWVFPEMHRGGFSHGVGPWEAPPQQLQTVAPYGAIHMLWRDELFRLCHEMSVPVGRRATMSDMLRPLLWHCTGAELTRGICAALRRRDCIEADPAATGAAA